MPNEFLTTEQIRNVMTGALQDFAKWDMELLHVKVQEETLSHRTAVYIEQRLGGWHIDCEYNRDLTHAKMSVDGLSRMRPDIIVHIRNSPHNLLVVEIKKTCHSKRQINAAKSRVQEFTGKWTKHPRYCHGAVLVFPVRANDPKIVKCEWFHRDGCGAIHGGEPKTSTMSVPLINNS
jgi:hypothetical protein